MGIVFGFQFGSNRFESNLEHQLVRDVPYCSSVGKWIPGYKLEMSQDHFRQQNQMQTVSSPPSEGQ
jgi:hypothetical protein